MFISIRYGFTGALKNSTFWNMSGSRVGEDHVDMKLPELPGRPPEKVQCQGRHAELRKSPFYLFPNRLTAAVARY